MDFTVLRDLGEVLHIHRRNWDRLKLIEAKKGGEPGLSIPEFNELKTVETCIAVTEKEISLEIVRLIKGFVREHTGFEKLEEYLLEAAYIAVTGRILPRSIRGNILAIIHDLEQGIGGNEDIFRFIKLVFGNIDSPLGRLAISFLSEVSVLSPVSVPADMPVLVRERFERYLKSIHRIYITLEPLPLDRQRFTVKVHDRTGKNSWPDDPTEHTEDCSPNGVMNDPDNGCTLSCIQKRLKDFFNSSDIDEHTYIDMFVPDEMLCKDFHSWPLYDSEDPKLFGTYWNLAVRSQRRLELQYGMRKLRNDERVEKKRWEKSKVHFVEDREVTDFPLDEGKEIEDVHHIVGVYRPRREEDYTDICKHIQHHNVHCFIETCKPDREHLFPNEVAKMVRLGLIAGVWLTTNTARSTYHYQRVVEKLRIKSLKELRDTFRRTFRGYNADQNLVLFWDDADHLPPPSAPPTSL